MTNLLIETESIIRQFSKEVAWVGSKDGKYAMSYEDFKKIADVEYDAGYGAQEIACDLVIVFTDGTWMDRGEYDGSEWWQLHKIPTKQPNAKPFTIIKVPSKEVGWEELETINSSSITTK